ncbi:hypothetical protein ASZ78_013261 [Callipepla squamata]|uniref:Uncharacterized protein n=1 Tax=Callipepla squamata TaxID=9009 RepID=A0A226MI15_CALSU|nr:hypothetical protein ASZ78_013261 [Callipepla squamata]
MCSCEVAARAQLFESAGSLKQVSSGRQAKAMYSCKAEHSHELSFPQGAIFSNGFAFWRGLWAGGDAGEGTESGFCAGLRGAEGEEENDEDEDEDDSDYEDALSQHDFEQELQDFSPHLNLC